MGIKKGDLLVLGSWIHGFIYMMSMLCRINLMKNYFLKYSLSFNSRKFEECCKIKINPEYRYEFINTLESQIRGQLKKGLAMIDFYESCGERNRLSKFGNDYMANLYIKL